MKAAVCREFGAPLQIENVEIASPGHNDISVDLAACAICHSDIMFIDGAWGGDLPAVFGHEASGVISAVGAGVRDMAVGDHVVVTLIRSCGHCHYCSQGVQVACETSFQLDAVSPLKSTDGKSIAHGLRTGAFAEKVVVHASQAVRISKDIPFDSASLLACGVMTGVGAVTNTASIPAGCSVVVIGTGGVGLNSVQGAAISGAATIIAIDVSDEKIAMAKTMGATHGINAGAENIPRQVRALTNGRGVDYVFVTVGVKQAIDSAYNMIGSVGTVVLVGMPANGTRSDFDPGKLAARSQSIIGSKMGNGRVRVDIPYLADLYQQGRLQLNELITGRFSLDEINEAIASSKSGDALRNVIMFNAG